ncbi:MAG: double-strand break repair protein AddB [Candidatus Saccharibacteria bacterium]|nr:double-strand break repair protein AddB [Pseudorhodobacter sp.]
MADPHLFHLPPGVDFATAFVLGLQDRMAGRPPEAMARTRVYVNSQRMRSRLVQVMTAQGASFLPMMTVVTEIGSDIALSDLPLPVPDLRQRLELARLIKQLLIAQPELAPLSARFDLAESLATLLAEMQDEDVAPQTLTDLDMSGHSAHWARAQAFLNIITPLYHARTDHQFRQRLAVFRLAAAWAAHPPTDPVIIMGSTGSRGTTALLMQTIAGLAKGVIVVPGFDTDLPPQVWDGMNDVLTDEDHPQFRFRKLMQTLSIAPDEVPAWHTTLPHDPARNRLVSLAMRPAPVTDQWLVEGQTLGDLTIATQNMTLIEATHPREEALTIALILRDAVENGTKAALITPDRGLSRRVAAALTRWGLVADDSAGSPLALSAAGRLLRHVARGFTVAMTADRLLILLKHPLTHAGAGRGLHLALTRDLELELRRNGPAFPTSDTICAWAKVSNLAETVPWASWVGDILNQFSDAPTAPLTALVARHIVVAETLARGQIGDPLSLWQGPGGLESRRLMDMLTAEAEFGDQMSPSDYAAFFDTQIVRAEVREVYSHHPLIAFYGAREAREMQADTVVLGGLTDGIWPAISDPDPWLNRRMRKDAGLLLPERQIGLAAHDFQQAIAARTVILTRSVRDAEAETVPSRWLNRLSNLMEGLPAQNGPQALATMRDRGRAWLDQARRLDQPDLRPDPALTPAPRPSPQPPVTARPTRLSLSRISTLIRDPYAIYARYILDLKPLDPLRHVAEDRDRGILIHRILEDFVRAKPKSEPPDQARRRLMAIAERVLQHGTPFPSARLLWLARLDRATSHLLRNDAKYDGTPILLEQRGAALVGKTGFTLFGTPDRIDMLPDGRLHLVDYKTGTPPTKAQQEAFDKQLLLAAAMAERGGFADLGPVEVARISYLGLGSGDKAVETEIDDTLLAEQWARFTQLITAYADQTTGYVARRAVFESRFPLTYDHLSRFGEWQMSDRAVAVLVGVDDAE